MRQLTCLLLLFPVFLLGTPQPLSPMGPEEEAKPQIKVMVLGTHFLPSDIMKNARQREAAVLVQGLARFRADQILLDIPFHSSWEIALNEKYQAFLEGEVPLNRSSREQIGFRLASYLGHETLYGIGVREEFDLGSALQWVAAQGEEDAVSDLIYQGSTIEVAKQTHAEMQALSQYLAYLNHPRNLSHQHAFYLKGLSRMQVGDEPVGVDILGDWYSYHLQLFAHLTQVAKTPGSQVILIVDSEHVPYLRELIEADPDYEWVSPLDYLTIQ